MSKTSTRKARSLIEVSKVCRGGFGSGTSPVLGDTPPGPGPPNPRGMRLPSGPDVGTAFRKHFIDERTETPSSPGFTHAVPGAWVAFSRGAGKLLGIFLVPARSARRCTVRLPRFV